MWTCCPSREVCPRRTSSRSLAAELGPEALQYGETAGVRRLRQEVARHFTDAGQDDDETVLITSGSQQALDILARLCCDPGDRVAIDDPGYVGAIQAFEAVGAHLVPVPVDEDGLDVAHLERRLRAGTGIRVCFTVADGHNPLGTVMSVERRHRLAALAQQFGFTIVDDAAYRHIGAHAHPALARLNDQVVTVGTFSKVLAPGLRVGWLHGPLRLVRAAERLKQSMDLHTTTLGQHVVLRLLEDATAWTAHQERVRAIYTERRVALLSALHTHMTEMATVRRPAGGIFVWVTLREAIDTRVLLADALTAGVAFAPGPWFAVSDESASRHASSMRLSISPTAPELFDEAVRRLAAVVRSSMPRPSGGLAVARIQGPR